MSQRNNPDNSSGCQLSTERDKPAGKIVVRFVPKNEPPPVVEKEDKAKKFAKIMAAATVGFSGQK